MADGGQINLRLSLRGAEEVRQQLAALGPSGTTAMRELDRSMRQPTAGLVALDTASASARSGLEGFAHRAGPVGGVLQAMGPWGLAAAAGIAAVGLAAAAALNQARGAMQLADQIEDSAKRIHIGVEALQEWRYAARMAGAEAQDADTAIGGFMRRFGEAQSGLSPRAMRPFAALGFTPEDLRNFASGEEALDAVIQRIGELGDASEQAAVAERLGLGPLLPLIREGSDEIARLRDEAQALGVVMDAELVARAAQAQAEFETLSQVIDIQLKSAFADMAPVIISIMGLVAQLATALNEAFQSFQRLENRSAAALQRTDQDAFREQAEILEQAGVANPRDLSGRNIYRWVGINPGQRRLGFDIVDAGEEYERYEGIRRRARRALSERPDDTPAAPDGAGMLDGPSGGGGGGGGGGASRAAAEAERRRQAIARNELRLEEQLHRERLQNLDAMRDEGTTLDALHATAQARLQREQEHERLALDRQVKEMEQAGELSDIANRNIAILREEMAVRQARESSNLTREQEEEYAEALLAAQQEYADLQTAILSMASSSATTQAERRDLELQLLDIAQQRVQLELEGLRDAATTEDARAEYVRALAALPQLFEGQRQQVLRSTAGPWEQFRNDQPRTSAQMRETFEGMAVDGLSDVTRGLIDAGRNVRSLEDGWRAMGETAMSVLGNILAQLYEMAMTRLILEPIGDALFGGSSGASGKGGGGGGGNFLSAFVSNLVGQFTGGGGAGGGGYNPFAKAGGAGLPDFSPGAGKMGDPGAGFSAKFEVFNHGGEKLSGEVTPTAQGARLDLYPEIKGAIMRAGQDGTLGRAAAQSPQVRQRG